MELYGLGRVVNSNGLLVWVIRHITKGPTPNKQTTKWPKNFFKKCV